jgi:hypothetical protein
MDGCVGKTRGGSEVVPAGEENKLGGALPTGGDGVLPTGRGNKLGAVFAAGGTDGAEAVAVGIASD